jgi:transcriptional regulator with PAS, ATPase and Fis domain
VELFGFEAGTFADARRAKPGLLERASHGTLFLDEIDALPLPLQAKLLSALEVKRVRRLGAVAERQLDVKLIAANPDGIERGRRGGTIPSRSLPPLGRGGPRASPVA